MQGPKTADLLKRDFVAEVAGPQRPGKADLLAESSWVQPQSIALRFSRENMVW